MFGYTNNTTSATSDPFTTTNQGSVVVHVSLTAGDSVTSVTCSHELTFTQAATYETGSGNGKVEVWTAYSLQILDSETITVIVDNDANGHSFMAFLVPGVPTSDYLDTNVSLPAYAGGTYPNEPTVSGINSTTGTFAIFFLSGDQIDGTLADPSGFTEVGEYGPGNGRNLYCAYKEYGALLSSESITYGTNPFGGYGWALAVLVFLSA